MTTVTLDVSVLSRNLRLNSAKATETNHLVTLSTDHQVFNTCAYYFCPVVSIRTHNWFPEPELILYSPDLTIALTPSNITYDVSLQKKNCEFPKHGIKRYHLSNLSEFSILFFQESTIFKKISCKIISVQH